MRRSLKLQRGRAVRCGVLALGCLALAGCQTSNKLSGKVDPKYGVSASARVIEPGQPVPKGGGTYRVGKPYVVGGRTYYPEENRRYRGEGVASWYGDDFHGRLTANGEVYDMHAISAAHPTMPMPSYARVTNAKNGRSLIVRVNDRGPYHADRVIDLSGKAAELLGFRGHGLARVRVEYVGPAALEGSDDRRLLATLREGEPAPAPSTVMIASAKPFLPDMDRPARPARAAAPPMPQERPYELSDDPRPTRSAVAIARVENERLPAVAEAAPALRWTPGPAPAVPAAAPAYAPARYDAAVGITTGRGLY
jgi:rare lipoprotein A